MVGMLQRRVLKRDWSDKIGRGIVAGHNASTRLLPGGLNVVSHKTLFSYTLSQPLSLLQHQEHYQAFFRLRRRPCHSDYLHAGQMALVSCLTDLGANPAWFYAQHDDSEFEVPLLMIYKNAFVMPFPVAVFFLSLYLLIHTVKWLLLPP
jgi:hypothetical protein